MRKFRALVGLNLKAMLSSYRIGGGKNKKKTASGLGAMIFLAFLALYLSGTYSFLFTSQLAPLGMLHLVILMMSVLAVSVGFIFTFFAAQGVVFGGKDNDLMLSLPIPPFLLLLARTLALYVENLVLSVFVMIPAGAAYLVYGGPGSIRFIVTLLIGTLFLAFLPTLVSLVAGLIVAWISSKFTKKGLLSSLLYVVLFSGFMVFMMQVSFSLQNIGKYAGEIESSFSGWGLPFQLLERAACRGELVSLLALAALCLFPFLFVVWLFAGQYKKIVTGLTARGARSDYKLGRVAASGCRRALLRKEARQFFGTPAYFLNAGIGMVFLLLGGFASLFFRGQISEFLFEMGEFAVTLPIAPLLALPICFMVGMTLITATSISLEGKQLWILKSAPITVEGIFLVKAGFQILIVVPCLLVSTACLAISFSMSFLDWTLIFSVGTALCLCVAFMGLFINLCFPKLDAPNATVVVKQSISVIISMLASFVLIAAGAIFCGILHNALGWTAVFLLTLVFYLALAGIFYTLLKVKGSRMFLEL